MAGEEVFIVGAGPVGLAAAILLARQGRKVTVFEGRHEIPDNVEESYPIGINPRALHCLREINPELEAKAVGGSCLVSAWQIFGGERMVADLPSGTVHGTTRGYVNRLLYEQALATENVTVLFNHKFADVRLDAKELIFDVRQESGTSQVAVPAGKGRVIATDGVYSHVRRAMERAGLVKSEVVPWHSEFRVLFSKPGQGSEKLDPSVHYIFSGCYAAIVRHRGVDTWTCVMSAKDTADPAERDLVLSKDPSDKNVAKLRALLQRLCPRVSPIIDDDELRRFFTRRSYRGAVVEVDRLHHGEWLLLLGDAAHSVLPPTGEGINSGLEDCTVLAEVFRTGEEAAFEEYARRRMPDLQGLHRYATYLNQGLAATGPDAGSRLMTMILQSLCKKVGLIKHIWEDFSFGPLATERRPYRQIAQMWSRQVGCLSTIAKCFCYPIYYGCCCCFLCPRRRVDLTGLDRSLKPPVGSA